MRKGFTKLVLRIHKDLHEKIRGKLELEKLSKDSKITIYGDDSYSLDWNPHLIYRIDKNMVLDHEFYCEENERREQLHMSYI